MRPVSGAILEPARSAPGVPFAAIVGISSSARTSFLFMKLAICNEFVRLYLGVPLLTISQMHNCNLRIELNAVILQRDEAIT